MEAWRLTKGLSFELPQRFLVKWLFFLFQARYFSSECRACADQKVHDWGQLGSPHGHQPPRPLPPHQPASANPLQNCRPEREPQEGFDLQRGLEAQLQRSRASGRRVKCRSLVGKHPAGQSQFGKVLWGALSWCMRWLLASSVAMRVTNSDHTCLKQQSHLVHNDEVDIGQLQIGRFWWKKWKWTNHLLVFSKPCKPPSRNHGSSTVLTFSVFFRQSSRIYSTTKLVNLLFAKELARRLKSQNHSNIIVNSLHPGAVQTGLFRNIPYFGGVIKWLIGLLYYTPEVTFLGPFTVHILLVPL